MTKWLRMTFYSYKKAHLYSYELINTCGNYRDLFSEDLHHHGLLTYKAKSSTVMYTDLFQKENWAGVTTAALHNADRYSRGSLLGMTGRSPKSGSINLAARLELFAAQAQ